MIDPAEHDALSRTLAGRMEALREQFRGLRTEVAYVLRDLADRLDPPQVLNGRYEVRDLHYTRGTAIRAGTVPGSLYGAGGMAPGPLLAGGQIVVHGPVVGARDVEEARGAGRVIGYREGLEDGRRGR